MSYQRVAIVTSIVNLILLGLLLTIIPTSAQRNSTPVIRTRAFELVDDNGKVRAQIDTEEGGEVVFRLRDQRGNIRAKFGAEEDGTGLVLLDDRTEPTVQIRAAKAGASVTVIDREGKQQSIK
jgi:hypothetical protein